MGKKIHKKKKTQRKTLGRKLNTRTFLKDTGNHLIHKHTLPRGAGTSIFITEKQSNEVRNKEFVNFEFAT